MAGTHINGPYLKTCTEGLQEVSAENENITRDRDIYCRHLLRYTATRTLLAWEAEKTKEKCKTILSAKQKKV